MPGKFNSPRDFTRSGPLSPDLVTVLILYMVSDAGRRGYAHLLRAFWDEVAAHGIRLPCAEPVSAASFCEARHKITPTFFRELLYQVAAAARPHDDPARRLWKGRRVFAADGTKLNLQRGDEKDVLVLDRGYPSHELLQYLCEARIEFLIRVPASHSFKAITSSLRF